MMPSERVDLSIVIPVHNESGNIGLLLDEIACAMTDVARYEVICVDDGSRDGSCAEIEAVASRMANLRLVRHAGRFGKSAALWTGAEAARGPWIATLDGDGQNDPADLARLWCRLSEEGFPANLRLVAGVRRGRADGVVKRISSRIANGVRRGLLKDGTPDTACGFKLIRRDAFLALPFFDNMHRFFPALIGRGGGDVMQFAVGDRPRRHGTTKFGLIDRLWVGVFDLLGVYWLSRRASFPKLLKDE